MRIAQQVWTQAGGWRRVGDDAAGDAQLVFCFAAPGAWQQACADAHLSALYPHARIVGCTTGGEILGAEVHDGSVIATALGFDSARVAVATAQLDESGQSRAAGRALAEGLPAQGLRAVLVLADGMRTNGSGLIEGLREVLPADVLITGGLAGDGADFRTTYVACDGAPRQGMAVAVGLYGDGLRLGCGSFGGWDRFGPARRITRSAGNVLYELDHGPALALYKRYLGDEAAGLPGSALLFPLAVRPSGDEHSAIVRTIVGIDEDTQSMTFAGDIPQGWEAQLMRGHFDGLVEGASRAGDAAALSGARGATLALLVSCIGRKLLMGQRIADEVEAVADSLGGRAVMTGFYSYGEIAPHSFTGRCELHNQTMTVTTIGEA